jgi:hypothetical protein
MANDLYYILAAKKGTEEYERVLPSKRNCARVWKLHAPDLSDLFKCTEKQAAYDIALLAEHGFRAMKVKATSTIDVNEMRFEKHMRELYGAYDVLTML